MVKTLKYLWASPNTLIGLIIGLLLFGSIRLSQGKIIVIECLPRWFPWPAMTLGHTVLYKSKTDLLKWYNHEMVHIYQYEKYGPTFLLLYLLSSLHMYLIGWHPYYDNFLEREAYTKVRYPSSLNG